MIINQLVCLVFISSMCNCQPIGQSTPFACYDLCVHVQTRTYTHAPTTVGATLNLSHLSTDSPALSAHPYIKFVCALLLSAASHKPRSRVLRLGPLHAAVHVSLRLLYQSALSTLISILLEEQRRDSTKQREN